MNDRSQEPDLTAESMGGMRYEATIHPGTGQRALGEVADLDLDRIPDPEGGVRLLVSSEEAALLARRGYEVRLLKAHPVQPLDRSLVMDDKKSSRWLEERVKGIRPQGGS